MQVRKPLRYSHEIEPVFGDVKKHFGDRLPPEWKDVVYAACFPQLLNVTDVLFEQKLNSDGKIELYENPGFTNFRNCFAREPDLAGDIWSYARECCTKYDAGKKHKTKAGLICAILLRSWRSSLVNDCGEYRSLTLDEANRLRMGKSNRLKVKELRQLYDKEIADWITRDYHVKVTKADVEKARQSIGKSVSERQKK